MWHLAPTLSPPQLPAPTGGGWASVDLAPMGASYQLGAPTSCVPAKRGAVACCVPTRCGAGVAFCHCPLCGGAHPPTQTCGAWVGVGYRRGQVGAMWATGGGVGATSPRGWCLCALVEGKGPGMPCLRSLLVTPGGQSVRIHCKHL